jgi:hypothetical protein
MFYKIYTGISGDFQPKAAKGTTEPESVLFAFISFSQNYVLY